MQPTRHNQSKMKLAGIVIAIIVVAGVVLISDYVKAHDKDDVAAASASTSLSAAQPVSTTSDTAASTTDSSSSATTSPAASTSTYKDGTYSATSSYYVPHGNESIQVDLTIKSGVVTDVSIVNSEGDHDSALYQQDFASVYKSYVVGKSINGLKIGVISGASDTTAGFNEALSQIQSKAQA